MFSSFPFSDVLTFCILTNYWYSNFQNSNSVVKIAVFRKSPAELNFPLEQQIAADETTQGTWYASPMVVHLTLKFKFVHLFLLCQPAFSILMIVHRRRASQNAPTKKTASFTYKAPNFNSFQSVRALLKSLYFLSLCCERI